MKEKVKKDFADTLKVIRDSQDTLIDKIIKVSEIIIDGYKKGKKVIFFGNGGSAADAQHLAAELIGRFQKERKALAALALSTNTSVITALGNDYGFGSLFSRQIEALVEEGDIAVGISTSGNSPNVIAGIKKAKEKGATTIGFCGIGGKLKEVVDIFIDVPSSVPPHIQEGHIIIGHIICGLVEDYFYAEDYR